MASITSFETSLELAGFPPSIEAVEAALDKTLPSDQRVLSWAIVRADSITKTVWIEGSLINSICARI